MRRAHENIWDFLSPIVEGMGFTFVGAALGQGESGLTLRVYIDRESDDGESGIVVDDCASVSRQVSAALDVEDLIAGEYCLEVSSPGMDRPLFSVEDFEQQVGNTIKVRMAVSASGRRNYKGAVIDVKDGIVTVEIDGDLHELQVHDVETANLVTRGDNRGG